MGAQHRRDGSDALVDHLPQPVGEGPSARESIIDVQRGLTTAAYLSAAGDASPSGGQTTTPSASGMRKFRNNRENIIQLPMAMMNSTCCAGSVTCFITSAQAASEMDLPARHSSVARKIALSPGLNRSGVRPCRR